MQVFQKRQIPFKIIFSLGFGHEHTRSDRDRHVRINFGIIQRGVEGNFKIIPHQYWDSLGTRYETRSVMHYGSYAGSFSKLFNRRSPLKISF